MSTITAVNHSRLHDDVSSLLDRYQDIVDNSLGKFEQVSAKLHENAGSVPVYLKCRTVPFVLRHKVEPELDKLLRNGVITSVEQSE